MAIIPNGQQFHTQSSDVNTKNKGSAQANSRRRSFTMQDIIDTVGASGGGLAYKQYIVKLTMSGDTLVDSDELYNDTGLTFSWAATGSNNQVNANVTGGGVTSPTTVTGGAGGISSSDPVTFEADFGNGFQSVVLGENIFPI